MKSTTEPCQETMTPVTKVSIPEDILEIARLICKCGQRPCNCEPYTLFLGGSTVHDILNNPEKQEKQEKQDYDFLMITESDYWLNTPAFSQFIPNNRIPHHYIKNTIKYGGAPTDIMMTKKPLDKYAEKLDFSICSIFIQASGGLEQIGLVYDPTGRGLDDLRNKKLQTINNPVLCFKDDPICVLRALKYIRRDYTLDPATDVALRQWVDTEHYENDHFVSFLTRQLESPHYNDIIELMKTYGLVSKMSWADIVPEDNNVTICAKLLSCLYLRYYKRTIANFSYDVAREMRSSLNPTTNPLSECDHDPLIIEILKSGLIATKQTMQARKYCEQLEAKVTKITAQGMQKEQEISTLQNKCKQLSLEFEVKGRQLKEKKAAHTALTDLEETYNAQCTEYLKLENSRQMLLNKIEDGVTSELKVYIGQSTTKQESEKQLLEKETKALAAITENNNKKRKDLDILQNKYNKEKAKVAQNAKKLLEVNTEIEELRAKMFALKSENDQSFNNEYDTFLTTLNRDQLESLFFKTLILDFRAIIAYKLGVFAQDENDYFKALYYFYVTLRIIPGNKQSQRRVAEIKNLCISVNWSETEADAWCTLGNKAKQDGKVYEALTYYTLAIQCDGQHVNAYVFRINIFYHQNHFIAFVDDYKTLKIIIDNKMVSANLAIIENLGKINEALQRKITLMIKKSSQKTSITKDLTINWNLAIMMEITNYNPIDKKAVRVRCYRKIIKDEPQKKIEYGLAHYELARNHCNEEKILAHQHYSEAIIMVPCLKDSIPSLEKIQAPDPLGVEKLSTGAHFFNQAFHYQKNHCYYLALRLFREGIKGYPNNPSNYWGYINCCMAIDNHTLVGEQILDQLISLYQGESCASGEVSPKTSPASFDGAYDEQPDEAIIKPDLPEAHGESILCESRFDSLRALTELYLYENDYQSAKLTLTKLIKLSANDKTTLYGFNIKTPLSIELIDLMKNDQKESCIKFFINENFMKDCEAAFKVYYRLWKIAKYEENPFDEQRCLKLALLMGAKQIPPSYEYQKLVAQLPRCNAIAADSRTSHTSVKQDSSGSKEFMVVGSQKIGSSSHGLFANTAVIKPSERRAPVVEEVVGAKDETPSLDF